MSDRSKLAFFDFIWLFHGAVWGEDGVNFNFEGVFPCRFGLSRLVWSRQGDGVIFKSNH